MGERSPRERLQDIVQWGERLASHVGGETIETFLANTLTQDAACRCIEVVGEAARHLLLARPDIEANCPNLELRKAVGARNVLAHGYLATDMRRVWVTATRSIPAMVEEAKRALSQNQF